MPSLDGVAVKVQPLPVHPGLLPLVRAMVIAGVTVEVTLAVMILELAGEMLPDSPIVMLGLLVEVVPPVLVVQMVVVAPSSCLYVVAA